MGFFEVKMIKLVLETKGLLQQGIDELLNNDQLTEKQISKLFDIWDEETTWLRQIRRQCNLFSSSDGRKVWEKN